MPTTTPLAPEAAQHLIINIDTGNSIAWGDTYAEALVMADSYPSFPGLDVFGVKPKGDDFEAHAAAWEEVSEEMDKYDGGLADATEGAWAWRMETPEEVGRRTERERREEEEERLDNEQEALSDMPLEALLSEYKNSGSATSETFQDEILRRFEDLETEACDAVDRADDAEAERDELQADLLRSTITCSN